MTLVIGAVIFVWWLYCLVKQTPEEYEEIRKAVEYETEHSGM